MGHGLGLRLCEPPSISPDDETVLEAGMTLTIEPGISFTGPGRAGLEKKVAVHEENVVVTDTVSYTNLRANDTVLEVV